MEGKKQKQNKSSGKFFLTGFSLIEILVSASIFLIIIVAIIGTYISAIKTQRYSLAYQQLLDQADYTINYMSKLIRMAQKDITGDCIALNRNFKVVNIPFPTLTFENYKGECVSFYTKDIGGGITKIAQEISQEEMFLTSDKFKVTNLKFILVGDEPGKQPKITILLEMEARNMSPAPKIKIQTTVSQRNLNIDF